MAFYVSVIDGRRSALALGPYNTHGAALAEVERVRRAVVADNPDAHWWGFGTCWTRTRRPPGRLNDGHDYFDEEKP